MNNPKIMCWNCKEISASKTSTRVIHLIRSHHPVVVCLVETRANSNRVDHFCSKIPQNWEWAALLANGFSGGIIVLWNKALGLVSPITVSRRALHLIISPYHSTNWIISVIYNSNRLHSQRRLWLELSHLANFSFLGSSLAISMLSLIAMSTRRDFIAITIAKLYHFLNSLTLIIWLILISQGLTLLGVITNQVLLVGGLVWTGVW